jgi:hypothetical protein
MWEVAYVGNFVCDMLDHLKLIMYKIQVEV